MKKTIIIGILISMVFLSGCDDTQTPLEENGQLEEEIDIQRVELLEQISDCNKNENIIDSFIYTDELGYPEHYDLTKEENLTVEYDSIPYEIELEVSPSDEFKKSLDLYKELYGASEISITLIYPKMRADRTGYNELVVFGGKSDFYEHSKFFNQFNYSFEIRSFNLDLEEIENKILIGHSDYFWIGEGTYFYVVIEDYAFYSSYKNETYFTRYDDYGEDIGFKNQVIKFVQE